MEEQMAVQTIVNQKLAFGVEGSFYDDSPRRVAPYSVKAGAIACAYTVDAANPEAAVLGGEGVFAGIAVNSKEYPIIGLEASLAFTKGAIAQLATMGHIIVKCTNEVAVGNACFYNTTDGTLSAAASGTEVDNSKEIPNSQFIFVSAEEGEVAVLQLG